MLRNIEAERVRKGLTREELIKELNVSAKTYYNWLNEYTDIPGKVLILLAKLFDAEAGYLMEGATGVQDTPDERKVSLLNGARKIEYSEIVENIKKIIAKKGMKQGVVAERAGFTQQEFSNMLNERRKLIRIEYLPLIAHALGVEVNDLYGVQPRSNRYEDKEVMLVEYIIAILLDIKKELQAIRSEDERAVDTEQ